MKQIQPVQIWYSGSTINCIYLNAFVSSLVLNESAVFKFQLLDNIQNLICEGTLIMDGQTYQDWNQDEFAWDWVASELNLTIIP